MRKKLILVAAPPACGKTYVSELLSKTLGHTVYLDKDDIAPILRRAFELCGEELDMDGEFYIKNLRDAEYATILGIAFSTLRFEDTVILNAPLGREVRDPEYMKTLKDRANALDAELLLVWVSVPVKVAFERMKMRNSDRDRKKLESFEAYAKNINYSVPTELMEAAAVDKLIVFDGTDEKTTAESLKLTVDKIKNN